MKITMIVEYSTKVKEKIKTASCFVDDKWHKTSNQHMQTQQQSQKKRENEDKGKKITMTTTS